MENLVFLLTASLVLYKSAKKPRTIIIGDTNCSLLFSPEAEFDFTQTDDGDQLYFAEYVDKKICYGVLCAQLSQPVSLEEAQDVMVTYLNRLRQPFNALYNTGVNFYPNAQACVTMIDYWQDENQLDWKVKGYTNGKTIAVLYVKNINDIAVEKQDEFLDSFCMGK